MKANTPIFPSFDYLPWNEQSVKIDSDNNAPFASFIRRNLDKHTNRGETYGEIYASVYQVFIDNNMDKEAAEDARHDFPIIYTTEEYYFTTEEEAEIAYAKAVEDIQTKWNQIADSLKTLPLDRIRRTIEQSIKDGDVSVIIDDGPNLTPTQKLTLYWGVDPEYASISDWSLRIILPGEVKEPEDIDYLTIVSAPAEEVLSAMSRWIRPEDQDDWDFIDYYDGILATHADEFIALLPDILTDLQNNWNKWYEENIDTFREDTYWK